MPKVSVIIPVYNGEKYLKEALDSVINQTLKDIEIICINDGSTDKSLKILQEYGSKDGRIKIINQNNKGTASARNRGFEIAAGEFIAVHDADDISLPHRLEKELRFLEENPNYSLTGSAFEIFPHNKNVYLQENPKLLDFFHTYQLCHSSVMFRKSDFEKYKLFYDESLNCAVDYDLWCRAVQYLKFHNLQEVLVMYRMHKQGIATKKRDERIKNTIKIQQGILDLLTSDNKMQKHLIDALYSEYKVTQNPIEQIFSIKNFLKFDRQYKIMTILGLKIKIYVKTFSI